MLILDELWYEHMNLEEHTKGDKEYFRELKTLADLGEKFVPMLTAECKELYEQISDKQLSINSLGEKDAFISGVKLGVKMKIDVLHCA